MELIETGIFGKPHGIKGEITAVLDSEAFSLRPGDFVFAHIDGLPVPFRITGLRSKGASLLLSLKGIENERDAAMISTRPLFIQALIAEGMECNDDDGDEGFYLDDLIGFTIVADDKTIGTVTDYLLAQDNPLFVVTDSDEEEIYIPAVTDFINEVDTDNRIIEMTLPEGLIDLNSPQK